ncbi:MAG: M20/M25/M40 family metallo-hydrolase, partial [Anaerolineaceae bacterium]|nr:M20/M25/M40 family metallo-hydrolase [Anaerolineaceae bacterium]
TMTDMKEFLKEMISASGVSGHESSVREIITKKWAPLVDTLQVSRLGSLEGLKCGSGEGKRRSILLAGHMDAIGLMATGVEAGFIRMTSIGGVDPRVLPGQQVVVKGREVLKGVIIQPPDRMIADHKSGAPVGIEDLYVDVGLEAEEVEKLVRPGDVISFGQEPVELAGETLAGHTLDDRTAVAAITACLEILQKRVHSWDVWAVATVQEEVSMGGAHTSTYGLEPDIGVAIDVTHAKGPGTSEKMIADLGKGLVIGPGPNVHPAVYGKIKAIAEEMEIPYQLEVMPMHSGTDAYAIQVVREGVPSMVVSLPLRYMHTPVEVVSLKDIQRVGRLLAEFITALDEEYIAEMKWEE